ncbi:MaoC family dehydratase N-terminal domain-containing protein [Microbacterium sp. LWH7-1.2]|uniref:MaoC family dehydratase n=1 Tax=Microbacterium sp. LWH7-1.2 TaxID=3135257 RepID=UPI0031388CF9
MADVLFDEIEVGTVLPSRTYTIEAGEVAAYRASLGLAEGDDVPPTFCVLLLREMRTLLPAPPGGIHAEQRFDFHSPLRIGDRIVVTSTVTEKYIRNERRNVVITTDFAREGGDLAIRGVARRIWAR